MGKQANFHYLMAIDAGTGSVRAIIFTTEGKQVAVGQREWFHQKIPEVEGSMDFDLNANWELVCQCITQALVNADISAKSIMAISSCSMREGIVVYNQKSQPIWACANVDARAGAQISQLKALQNNHFEENMYSQTGQTLALSALPRLAWLKQHKLDIYEQISAISMISDWINYMLCNEISVDPSNAGTTGMLNLSSRNWNRQLLIDAELNPEILPPVKETGTIIGTLTEVAAKQTGLSQGTPVVIGGGDVQLGCLGLGIVNPNQAAILGGSFWQQIVNLPTAKTDPNQNIRFNPHVIPQLMQAESISFFTGLVMRWFRDVFCETEKLIAKRLGKDPYQLLEAMAAEVPCGSYGIMPIFSDVMHFNNWYHAAPSFVNLSIDPKRCNKASLFRSLEENAAIVSSCNLDQVFSFSQMRPKYLVFAGGAAKGALWCQILADVTGFEIYVPVVKEATALGCSIAAGVGVGIYDHLACTGKALVRIETIYTPDPKKHKLYAEIKQKWVSAYELQLTLVDKGITTSLWKAAGL
ncbi:MAG: autoinducer-2 kinase [Ostreibacterium sp.]